MPLPQWFEEDNVNRTHSRDSILIDSEDESARVSLPEDQDDELRQLMDSSSSNANDTTNIQTAKAAPIHQRRRSQRIMAMNRKGNAISAVKRRQLKKSTNRIQTKAKLPVVLPKNQPDFPWQSKLEKRKRSGAQNKERSKTNLSVSVWKYFTDIKPQIQSLPDSFELITVEVGGIEPGPSNANPEGQSSSSKEKFFSAKCTICGERKQFQKGNAWNMKSHLGKVCFKFNFYVSFS